MFELPPDFFPDNLDPRISAVLPKALPQLLIASPAAPNPDIIAVREQLERDLPSGHRRDCMLAALWLLEGNLDRAHRLCQDVPTPLGSAWHAVVHRLEGDFWNSKYWWRRASGLSWNRLHEPLQKIFAAAPPELQRELTTIARVYDPAQFVDLTEKHAKATGKILDTLLDIQRAEWAALVLETWQTR